MSQQIFTTSLVGIDGVLVTVEADTASAIPSFTIVGLPDAAVKEARERIRAAIKNSGFVFPRMRVVVNLAPADVPKEGTGYDLPIAVAILCASDEFRGRVQSSLLNDAVMVGELALSGETRAVHGALVSASVGLRTGKRTFYCPSDNVREARLLRAMTVYPTPSLRALVDHFFGVQALPPDVTEDAFPEGVPPTVDCAHIVGNEHAKRALLVAAAGNHSVRMTGPPGSGKSMLARALPGIMPSLSVEEMLEVTRIWSVGGFLSSEQPWLSERPFRDPHHSASLVALVGGGANPRPGEISLAHRGVLFLDEFAEFPRSVLESLRQPLEAGCVTIARANDHVTFPSRFLLVAAQNPCPCGYLGDPVRPCTCTPSALTRYRAKISGPILDRIDLHIEVPRLPIEKLEGEGGTPSITLRAEVEKARDRQRARFTDTSWKTNAEMPSEYIRHHLLLSDEARARLRQAVQSFHLSGRVYFRILKVAQTIADLAAHDTIDVPHIAEALQYRLRDAQSNM